MGYHKSKQNKASERRAERQAAGPSPASGVDKTQVAPPAAEAEKAPAGPTVPVVDNATGDPKQPVADSAAAAPVTESGDTMDVDQGPVLQTASGILLDLSEGIPWEDESLDIETRVSAFGEWDKARAENYMAWKALGKPKCNSCGKLHALPCVSHATFKKAMGLGKQLKEQLEAQAKQPSTGTKPMSEKARGKLPVGAPIERGESSAQGARNAAQTESNKTKGSQTKQVCNRVCTHCGKKHFYVKKYPNGCKVRPCPACGKGHSAGTCAELRERFVELGIMVGGVQAVANTNALHGYVPQPVGEVLERGAQIVSSAPPKYKALMQALATRAVEMAAEASGHTTLPDRTKRSKEDDDDDSDGGRPAEKKSKRKDPYGRR